MYLVAAGLGLACRATDSNLPLAAAAAQGELATVRQLLAAGADVDEVDDSGWSAVIRATRQRELSTLTALLEAGADLDRSDTRRGWTPLLHAVHIGALDPARALLAHGAGPNLSASEGGQTPLIMTAGYGAVPMIELLLTHDADPARGGDIGTSLGAAVGGSFDIDRRTLGQCQTDAVRTLLAKAPDLRLSEGVWDQVALRLARWSDCREVLRLLSQGVHRGAPRGDGAGHGAPASARDGVWGGQPQLIKEEQRRTDSSRSPAGPSSPDGGAGRWPVRRRTAWGQWRR